MGFVLFIFVHYSVGILQVRLQHIVENLQYLDAFFFFSKGKKSTIAE